MFNPGGEQYPTKISKRQLHQEPAVKGQHLLGASWQREINNIPEKWMSHNVRWWLVIAIQHHYRTLRSRSDSQNSRYQGGN